MTSDRASTRMGPVAAGAPSPGPATAPAAPSARARPAPEATDRVVTTGAMRSTSARSRAWTMATLTPSSLTLITTDSTTSAAANTPNSDGAIRRARAMPDEELADAADDRVDRAPGQALADLGPQRAARSPRCRHRVAPSQPLQLPAERAQLAAGRWVAPTTSSGGSHTRPATEAAAHGAGRATAAAAGQSGQRLAAKATSASTSTSSWRPGRGPGWPATAPGGRTPARPGAVAGASRHGVAAVGEEGVEGRLAVAEVDQRVGEAAAQHAPRVHPVDRLGHALDVGDVGHGGDAQPHLEVARVGQRRLVAADGAVDRRRAPPPRARRCTL